MFLVYQGNDLTTSGKTYTASANAGANYLPQYAFNQNINGTQYWAAILSSGQWLAIDMGSAVQIDRIDLGISTSAGANEAPKDFKFQFSNDNSNWFDLLTVTNQTSWTLGSRRSYSIPPFGGAYASDPGPLQQPAVLGTINPQIFASAASPLGAINAVTHQLVTFALAETPLGSISALATHVFGYAAAPSMLGTPSALAWHLFARADVPSVLGSATPLTVHDFTGQLGDATTYYVMDLTTPSGTVRVPISSWQATLQTGLSNYVQCVVPAVQSYVTQINAATQFKILRRVVLPDGFVIEYQMASGPLQTVTLDQGPFRYTATIAGYSSGFAINETPSPAYNRTMSGLRSVSVSEGKARVRCSIDWLLRPSQRVFAGDRNFIASYINYYVGNNDAYMEVGER